MTRKTQKQRESRDSTCASWLRDIDLNVVLTEKSPTLQQILSTKRHELSHYILEDILDCPVGSRFILCVAADGGQLEREDYYTDKANTNANQLNQAGLDTEWWRMNGQKYIVIQGKLDRSSHYLDIK